VLPIAGARDVVFFMHGILDTSMGWVCNGVTGSNAFAAYDAGFDVWLGNSRANPPRLHMGESACSESDDGLTLPEPSHCHFNSSFLKSCL